MKNAGSDAALLFTPTPYVCTPQTAPILTGSLFNNLDQFKGQRKRDDDADPASGGPPPQDQAGQGHCQGGTAGQQLLEIV